jgi:hypothetical protein
MKETNAGGGGEEEEKRVFWTNKIKFLCNW